MELTSKRRDQIAQAAFDLYVLDKVVNEDLIENDHIDLRILNLWAKEVGCSAHTLSLAIAKACSRLSSEPFSKHLPKEEEKKVILAIAKYRVKEIAVPLKDVKRELGNLSLKINNQYPVIRLKTKELRQYIYPIYLEVLEEIFES